VVLQFLAGAFVSLVNRLIAPVRVPAREVARRSTIPRSTHARGGIGLCLVGERADTHVARCGPRCWWVDFWDLGGTQSYCQALKKADEE
jgi:hypothetical protein